VLSILKKTSNSITKLNNSITNNACKQYLLCCKRVIKSTSNNKKQIKYYNYENDRKNQNAFVFTVAMMFANNAAQETTNQDTNYDQEFRLGVGLNAGYSTNDPYKLALEQMLEDNTIYQKDTFDIDYRLH
jgi:hypothetical protein